jgi:hypothetical protein
MKVIRLDDYRTDYRFPRRVLPEPMPWWDRVVFGLALILSPLIVYLFVAVAFAL